MATRNDSLADVPVADTAPMRVKREIMTDLGLNRSAVAGSSLRLPTLFKFVRKSGGLEVSEKVDASVLLASDEPTMTLSFFPPSPVETFRNVTVTVDTLPTTPAGSYFIAVSGTSVEDGSPYNQVLIPFTIVAQERDVQLTIDPAEKQSLSPGTSLSYTVKIQRINFSDPQEPVHLRINAGNGMLADKVTATFVTNGHPTITTNAQAEMLLVTAELDAPSQRDIPLGITAQVGNSVWGIATDLDVLGRPSIQLFFDPPQLTINVGDTRDQSAMCTVKISRIAFPGIGNGTVNVKVKPDANGPVKVDRRQRNVELPPDQDRFELEVTVDKDAEPGQQFLVPITATKADDSMVRTKEQLPIWTKDEPFIFGVNPMSGPVGQEVTIQGSRLKNVRIVEFGPEDNIRVKVSNPPVDSSTQVRATVPLGAITGPITVTTVSGEQDVSGNDFQVVPKIIKLDPDHGRVGSTVDIHGTGFDPRRNPDGGKNTAVSFNGVMVSESDIDVKPTLDRVSVHVPRGATTGRVSVTTTPGGTGTSDTDFTVLP